MSEPGALRETYHAALQHGHVDPAEGDVVLGVVREQMYGFQNQVERNCATLAPPEELLTEFKRVAEEVGHNPAVDKVNFRDQYHAHLENDEQQEEIHEIVELVKEGKTVWLVCYEGEDKFCHRRLLKSEIESQLNSTSS
jgi:uncharacterized protein YeaO (DUF488 family)